MWNFVFHRSREKEEDAEKEEKAKTSKRFRGRTIGSYNIWLVNDVVQADVLVIDNIQSNFR